MNGGPHAALAIWGLDFGGGANLQRLMQRSLKGKVTGVDYSPVSVEKSRKVNANAFETVYFWPDIEKSFSEVKRILAPGGKFLIMS